MTSSLSRRRALSGAATMGVGLPLLAACGNGNADAAQDPTTAPTSGDTPAGTPTATQTASGTPSSGGSGGGLVAAADVPVGGGVIVKDAELVVTQPSAGEFKAFSAICTHQGCLVGSVTDGQIHCPCHGSSFSISDGEPQGGPAQTALPSVAVKVDGDEVTRA